MSLPRIWSSAANPSQAAVPGPAGSRPRPQLVSLPAGLPSLADLFTFARDAELRFDTLRARIEERSAGALGERVVLTELAIRHPGHARTLTSEPALGTAANYEIWVSDGEMIRTYSATHRKATERPVRSRVRGLNESGIPATARVDEPVTVLAEPSVANTFMHPAGYCQNVLATGSCRVVGTDVIAGREAIVVECDHPRTTQLAGDRPDYSISVSFDRSDGVITRLVERLDGAVTREIAVVAYETNVVLPDSTFEIAVPEGTHLLY